jgi:MFS family permease
MRAGPPRALGPRRTLDALRGAPAFRALRHRDFRPLLAGTVLVGLVQPLHFVTQIFWVQAVYPEHEIIYTGLLMGARGVATLSFGLIGGAIADRFERRLVLLGCESASLVLSAFVALLMLTTPFGGATIIGVAALTFLAAATQAIDHPARQASLPAVAGRDDLSNAISLNSAAQQLMIPITIPIAAVLNDAFGAGVLYAGSLVTWLGILPLIALLDYRSRGAAAGRQMLSAVVEGLQYTRRHLIVLGAVALVFVMHGVGMPGVGHLGILWATNILEVGGAGFAFMAFGWGVGAVAGSMYFAQRPDVAGRGSTLVLGAVGFAVAAIVFAHSRSIELTTVANVGLGVSLSASTISASVIIQQKVAEGVRGRVLGLFPLTNGFAMLLTLPISAVAEGAGLVIVVTALAWATLVCSAAIVMALPQVRRVRPDPAYSTAPG